jgi:hypothetical protein
MLAPVAELVSEVQGSILAPPRPTADRIYYFILSPDEQDETSLRKVEI